MHIIGLIRAYGDASLCKSYEYQRLGFSASAEPGVWESLEQLKSAYNSDSGKWIEGIAVGRGVSFHGYREESVSDLQQFAELLKKLESHADISLVCGRMRADAHFQVAGDWRDALRRTKDLYEDAPTRLLVLDIDRGCGEESGDIRADVREALDQVDELNGCAYVAQLSSSRGIKPGLRVRVFVETSHALTLEQQHAFVSQHGPLFDGKIYLPGHIVASAAPKLHARVGDNTYSVPRPVRAPTIWYEPGIVADIDPIDVRELARAAGVDYSIVDLLAANADTRGALDNASPDDLIAQLSPGNINVPLNRLVCSVAWGASDATQQDEFRRLFARVMSRLKEISVDGRFDERVRVHMRPADWQRRWDAARARRDTVWRQQLEAAKPLVAPTTPTQTAAPDTRTPRERLCDAMRDAGVRILGGEALQVLVTTPPGGGKSFGMRAVITPGTLMRNRMRVLAPTHPLAAQIASDLQQYVSTLAPNGEFFGTKLADRVRHHKGRTQPGMCIDEKHGELATRAERAGLGARNSVCKTCPSRTKCPWFAQADDRGEGIIVEVHANMLSRGRQKDDWAELTIIDEAIFATVIGEPHTPVPVKSLTEFTGATAAHRELQRQRADLVKVLQRGFAPRIEWGRVPTPPDTDYSAELAAEEQHRQILQSNIMSAMPKRLSEMFEMYARSCVATSIYENISESKGKPTVFGVRVHRRKRRENNKTHIDDVVVSLRRAYLPEAITQRGAIWLDGTAALDGDLSVWRSIIAPDGADFKHEVIDVALEAPEHVSVTQIVDSSYAKSALSTESDDATLARIEELEDVTSAGWQLTATATTTEEATALRVAASAALVSEREKAKHKRIKAGSRLHKVWMTVQHKARQHAGKTVLLVAQKRVIERLKAFGLPPNVATAWFGALRGLNAYKDVPCAIVVGRPATDNVTLELMCEALHVRNPAITHIEMATGWGLARAALPLKDGTEHTTMCEAHPDKHAQKLQRMISHAEVVQAVARVRPYDRTIHNSCELLVMGQWPMQSMIIDKACELNGVTPNCVQLAVMRGAVADNELDNKRLWPALFDGFQDVSRIQLEFTQSYVRAMLSC